MSGRLTSGGFEGAEVCVGDVVDVAAGFESESGLLVPFVVFPPDLFASRSAR